MRRVVREGEATLFILYLTFQSPTVPVQTHTHTHTYIETSTTALLAGALRQPRGSRDQSWELSGEKLLSRRPTAFAVIADRPAYQRGLSLGFV